MLSVILITLAVSGSRLTIAELLGGESTTHQLSLIATPVISLVALGSLVAGRTRLAAQILIWGLWAVVMVSALFTSGNRSIGIVSIPLFIVLAGWLFSPRHALIVTVASCIALLGISLSEAGPWIPLAPPLPPLTRWVILSSILAMTAFLTALAHRLYIQRYDVQRQLATTLKMITEHSPIMLAAVDAYGRYRYVNHNYANFHGRSVTSLVGSNVADIVGSDTLRQIRRLLLEGKGRGSYRFRRHDHQSGTERWVEACVQQAASGDTGHHGYYAILRDVTAEIRTSEEIRRLAYYDALTGLPNRALMQDRLRQAVLRAAREDSLVAVCHLDVDGFHLINESWGHAVGDDVLTRIARRLSACVRGTDTVARLGGDEFVILIGDLGNRNEMSITLERLVDAIAAPIDLSTGDALRITASIGVALCPTDSEVPDLLLRRADQAMLTAKQSGRDRIVLFDPDLEQRIQNLHQLADRIERALDRSEFALELQPQLNLQRGTPDAFDAHLRWHVADGEPAPPADFLAQLEGHRTATRLGRWLLGEAIRQAAEWHRQGLRLPVSISISGELLREKGFVEHLADLLDAHPRLPPERLELAISESAVIRDLDQTIRVMTAGVALGVRFALDRCGNGQISVADLARLPIQTLRIDPAFVSTLDAAPPANGRDVVQALAALAHGLHCSVLACGLQDATLIPTLSAAGCNYAMGLAIAAPMPASNVPRWLGSQRLKAII